MKAPDRNRERGSVAVVMAVTLTVFFGFVALSVDIGYLYLNKRRVQTVADLAALAGGSKLSMSTSAAQSASQAIETQNGYTAVTATFPAATPARIQLTLATPAKSLFFGRIFGATTKILSATAAATSGTPIPAIWAGGGCGSSTGLQLNGGPFTVTGNLVSAGPLNYYTGGAGTTTGSVRNSSSCMTPPTTTGTVTGGSGQDPSTNPEFNDPLGYNILTDFPACTAGTNLTTPVALYNVPIVGGVIAPGIYCANGPVNISAGGSVITAIGVTILATGYIEVSGNSLNMSAAANTHNIAMFSTATGTTLNCSGIPAIGFGFPGVRLTGTLYAPNGCINLSGNDFQLTGSMIGKEVQFGAGGNWSVDASSSGSTGSLALYQ